MDLDPLACRVCASATIEFGTDTPHLADTAIIDTRGAIIITANNANSRTSNTTIPYVRGTNMAHTAVINIIVDIHIANTANATIDTATAIF